MSIKTKTILELKDHCFFVPAYQRGYRWTKYEVTALLNDISEFVSNGDQCYCMQPLIIKRHENEVLEVVDGQQRLTSIYIFMKIASQEIRSATPPFELKYETRVDSENFLKLLSDNEDLENEKRKNIDYYHIASAYEAINEWLDQQPDKSVAIQELNTKIRKSVFFIWYEIPAHIDPIAMFTKVNLGRIPLTNAELIKALLLNKENFSKDTNKLQTEISIAWDRIEQGLRDDSFWYFLNAKEQSGTRIDMLFELLADEQNNKLSTPIDDNQNYFPFLVFSMALNDSGNKENFVKELWGLVEKLYADFREWYLDLDKYHIIGYLIASDVSIKDVYALTQGKRKSEINKNLIEKAKKVAGKTDQEDLVKITYGVYNKRIRNLLLLFNLATLICKSEKQYRFPFNIYKGEVKNGLKWDIEHIHATADETDEADDSLWNLTLLERGTNRSPIYAAKPFDEKRHVIIERESKGLFVPLCTKNVFLKVYSRDLKNMEIWNNHDKEDHLAEMVRTFKLFFDGRTENA
ncbi:MAG: DUF262 domain-containing protein [Eubacteriaceae bacterium]|nr:DUF262 domain-containing protein [Eubacteriaceae bacterium]